MEPEHPLPLLSAGRPLAEAADVALANSAGSAASAESNPTDTRGGGIREKRPGFNHLGDRLRVYAHMHIRR